MADIRSIDQIASKWATVTPMRSGDYEDGVKNPRKSWAAGATAASDAYDAGVQKAITDKRFGKGVRKAGDPKWTKGCVEKGVSRWGPGVALAQDEFRSGFAPYRDAISRIKLSPRYARRDPRNLKRVAEVVDALSKAKERQLSGGS